MDDFQRRRTDGTLEDGGGLNGGWLEVLRCQMMLLRCMSSFLEGSFKVEHMPEINTDVL